jgi:hypothetical protein
VDGCGDVNRLVALVNGDLQRILDWSRDNSLILNLSKTQALLVSRRIRPKEVGSDVILGGDPVRLSDVVKNLWLYVDGRLNWKKQVSYVVSRTFSTLRLLYRFKRYTSRDLRIYLVRSLNVPIFLYSDFIYFPSLTGSEFRSLELAFNACTRYEVRSFFVLNPSNQLVVMVMNITPHNDKSCPCFTLTKWT